MNMEEFGAEQLHAIDIGIRSLAENTRDKWISLAQERLKSARSEYINGLQDDESFQQTGESSYEISLVGKMPNMFESGFSSYDMKPGMLGGKNAKTTKTGKRYATVPFRHYKNAKAAERISKVPNYKQDLKRVLKHSGLGQTKKGLVGKVGVANTGSLGIAKLKAHHKTDIYQGITQYQKNYGKKTESTLTSFRRVSEKSDPASWLHPGYSGAHLMPEVGAFVEEQIGILIDTVLRGK